MSFLKALLRNIAILIVIFLAMLIFMPDVMSQVYSTLGALFGPLLILMVIVAALPRKRRGRY
ncbi:MAG: hypothetical protein JW891_07475 [Candidatus Lokiarchaeota archaeon]|nr:hypothetical protein [Candidatus Lokiarchaeota archaeon]